MRGLADMTSTGRPVLRTAREARPSARLILDLVRISTCSSGSCVSVPDAGKLNQKHGLANSGGRQLCSKFHSGADCQLKARFATTFTHPQGRIAWILRFRRC